MSILYGNARLIIDVALTYLVKVLFLYITLPLMAVWLIIGLLFNLPTEMVPAIPIPVYINIALFAMAGFKPLFQVAVGMGSTRLQFLKTFYGVGIAAITVTILLLNICQYVLLILAKQWIGWSKVLHPAMFFRQDFQFIPYFWIDLMLGLFLLGFSFLVFCLWYRLGSVRSLMLLMVVIISGLFLYYGGVLDTWFTWIWLNLKPMTAFNLLGIIGLATLFSTYPLMCNAPLQPNPGRN